MTIEPIETSYENIEKYKKIIIQMKDNEKNDADTVVTNDYIGFIFDKLSSSIKIELIRLLITSDPVYIVDRRVSTNKDYITEKRTATAPVENNDEEIEDLNKTELIKLKTWLIKAIFLTIVGVAIITLFIIVILGAYGYSIPMTSEIKDIFNAIFS